jgi:hypothetical protein
MRQEHQSRYQKRYESKDIEEHNTTDNQIDYFWLYVRRFRVSHSFEVGIRQSSKMVVKPTAAVNMTDGRSLQEAECSKIVAAGTSISPAVVGFRFLHHCACQTSTRPYSDTLPLDVVSAAVYSISANLFLNFMFSVSSEEILKRHSAIFVVESLASICIAST